MKVTIYTKPGEDPHEIAERAKAIIESITKQSCMVKLTGGSFLSLPSMGGDNSGGS